jgi:hypothetical protein
MEPVEAGSRGLGTQIALIIIGKLKAAITFFQS